MKSFKAPAFICIRCLKELGRSWNFRMAATTAEKHFKKKTFAIETRVWGFHKPVQPEPPPPGIEEPLIVAPLFEDEVSSNLETPEEEFTFTIKTEPEDFVFEPLETSLNQNLEIIMNCQEEPVFKFESTEEDNLLHEKIGSSNKSSKWQCEVCSKVRLFYGTVVLEMIKFFNRLSVLKIVTWIT